ncbi:hypothetical protein ACS15_5514 [Ralstonia insidiosa]|uniref:Uncharacterized protein n=1 Tax=Ralstonia insidiosa TaxID=190721 RepID=A0AAC9BLM1_9RALS|nr:hypothetical protein ACS15_5514 [Ralstonia insidiosa]
MPSTLPAITAGGRLMGVAVHYWSFPATDRALAHAFGTHDFTHLY